MINDVLSVSRIEARKMSLDLAMVEVEELIEHARQQVEQINRDAVCRSTGISTKRFPR
jgi:signal transduction histidine kinase